MLHSRPHLPVAPVHLIALLLLVQVGSCARKPIPASDFRFDGIFAPCADDSLTVYCLLGTGFFRTISSGAQDSLISGWLLVHPLATVTPVTSIDMGSGLGRLVYIWIEDGDNNLNVSLVRSGAFPGGVMTDAVEAAGQAGKSPEVQAIEDGYNSAAQPGQEPRRAVNAPPDRIVSDARYTAFMRRVVSAELAARADRLGIWSEEFQTLWKQRQAE